MKRWVLSRVVFGLFVCGCGGGDDPSDGATGAGGGLGTGDGDASSSGGMTSSGGLSGTGGETSTGGTETMMGSGGETMTVSGAPFVFVGSTEGDLRAYTMSETDGSLTAAGSVQLSGLGFFTVGPSQSGDATRTVFVSRGGEVQAVDYDPIQQTFTPGPTANTAGGGTHVATDPTGGAVMIAHYNEGALSYFGFSATDGFGAESTFSPGSNAHQVRVRGSTVYVPCLGSNYVAQYGLAVGAGLTAAAPPTVPAGGGPRHMDFHPTGSVAYVLSELSSEIHVYDVGVDGALTQRPDASVFTNADEQYRWSSDIKVTPDGAHLYAVNRKAGEEEIVLFTVGSDLNLTRGASAPLTGEVRSFGMDPQGKFLQVGAKNGVLQTFAIDPVTGELTMGPSLNGLGAINNTEVHYLEGQ